MIHVSNAALEPVSIDRPVVIAAGPLLAHKGLIRCNRNVVSLEPHDSTFSPHRHRITVALVLQEGISNRCTKGPLDPLEIASTFGRGRAGVRKSHDCSSFRDFHVPSSATTGDAPTAREATRCGLTTSALS
jgi:hypothetical protein